MSETGGNNRAFELFWRDVRRSLRAMVRDPRLPITALLIALIDGICPALATSTGHAGYTFIGLLTVVFLGFYGTERIWFVFADRGLWFSWFEFRHHMRALWGRFFRLGLLVTLLFGTPSVIVVAATDASFLRTAVILGFSVLVDAALTFAPAALAFDDITARGAIRRSFAVVRAQWPRCLWYVLAAPLAITVTVRFLPSRSLGFAALLGVDLAIAAFAVVCKGATVLFYADRYPTLDEAQMVSGAAARRRHDRRRHGAADPDREEPTAPDRDFWRR